MRRDGWWFCQSCDVLFNEKDQWETPPYCPLCGIDDDGEEYECSFFEDGEDDGYGWGDSGKHVKRIGKLDIELERVHPRSGYANHPIYRWTCARGEAIVQGDRK